MKKNVDAMKCVGCYPNCAVLAGGGVWEGSVGRTNECVRQYIVITETSVVEAYR